MNTDSTESQMVTHFVLSLLRSVIVTENFPTYLSIPTLVNNIQ